MLAPHRTSNHPNGRAIRPVAAAISSSVLVGESTWNALRGWVDDLGHRPRHLDSLMATHAHTFFFASRFLPPVERSATTTLYGFFRTLDDLVDDVHHPDRDVEQIATELDAWRSWFSAGMTSSCPRPEIGVPLAVVIHRYRIPSFVFADFLDGLASDLRPEMPETMSSLEHYCYQVASTVGLSMAHVLDATSDRALEAARAMGIAMQLTNILRDVGGDLDRGRIYLPAETVREHGLTPDEIVAMRQSNTGPDDRYRSLMARIVRHADAHYAEADAGIFLLPERVRMPIMVASRLYQTILRRLEENDYDSLRVRVSTTRAQKVREAIRCLFFPSPAAVPVDFRQPAHSDDASRERA